MSPLSEVAEVAEAITKIRVMTVRVLVAVADMSQQNLR